MSNPCKVFQYSVKFVCGLMKPSDKPSEVVVAPGHYFTAINVFNPALCKAVTFHWRVVVAKSYEKKPAQIQSPRDLTLRPGMGVEIDTHNILGDQTALRKGFVIIESPCELDVVAVYSASPLAQGAGGGPAAFHTERVPARRVEACKDLQLDLSTGIREWTITQARTLGAPSLPLPNLTTPRPASVIESAYIPSTWLTPAGTYWIGAQSFAQVPNLTNPPNLTLPGFVGGRYTFRTCFSLCASFSTAKLELWTLNDDQAEARLNGTLLLPPMLSNYAGPALYRQITSGFLPGMNCLEIVVNNLPNASVFNPMGLNVRALLAAVRGACDCGCGCGCENGCDDEPPPRGPDPNKDHDSEMTPDVELPG